ncbi:MAG TPA: hypothetical protein VH333_05795 [Pseudonocardiaceae bacterium]|nr:hypothetical protein [Pseudonocardiaceae bacterium]
MLLELRRDTPAVRVESCGSVTMLTHSRAVGRYRSVIGKIMADSLDADASVKRIAEIAKDMETAI